MVRDVTVVRSELRYLFIGMRRFFLKRDEKKLRGPVLPPEKMALE